MIITCPECQTSYRLDPARLGDTGHDVRCTSCGHMWFQEHVRERHIEDVLKDAEPEEAQEPVAGPPHPPAAEEDFADLVQDIMDSPAHEIPDAVMPVPRKFSLPAMAYRPMQMGPSQFGALAFLLCCFVSLSLLLLFKAQVVRAAPPMRALYKVAGIDLPAPGEGLRLQEMIAVRDGEDDTGVRVEARLSNMTQRPAPYPAVKITLRSAYGAALRDWVMSPQDDMTLKAGETVPLAVELEDVPEGGTDVDIRVVENGR